MENFAGFLSIVVVRWLPMCSWRSVVGFLGHPTGMLEVILEEEKASSLHRKFTKLLCVIHLSDL